MWYSRVKKKISLSHLDQKFKDIIEVLKEEPFQKPHPFEQLVGNLKDKYSRRLNIQHRVVYPANNDAKEILIWSAWTHYER